MAEIPFYHFCYLLSSVTGALPPYPYKLFFFDVNSFTTIIQKNTFLSEGVFLYLQFPFTF